MAGAMLNAFQQTFQLRAYTTKAGYGLLDQVLAQQCTLYNAALEHRKTAYKMAGVRITYRAQSRELTDVRRDDPALASISRRVQCGTLTRLEHAFQGFFRRLAAGQNPGYPRFKSFWRWNTLEVDSPKNERAWLKFKPEAGRIYLAVKGLPRLEMKAPEARCIHFQELVREKKWTALRVTRRGRRVTVNLTFEVTKEPRPKTGAVVGLNRGVVATLATSDGEHIQGKPRDWKRWRRLQRKVARGQKGSRNRRRKAAVFANFCYREALAKRNELHRITSKLARDYDFIALEDFDIPAMTRSAAGTIEEPGTDVSAKSGLNRSILEQNWGMLHGQLAYKAAWAGRRLVAVTPGYITQECSGCGQRRPGPFANRRFRCRNCGLFLDQDTNAAINVLRLGQAQAGAETVSPGAPQGVYQQGESPPVCV